MTSEDDRRRLVLGVLLGVTLLASCRRENPAPVRPDDPKPAPSAAEKTSASNGETTVLRSAPKSALVRGPVGVAHGVVWFELSAAGAASTRVEVWQSSDAKARKRSTFEVAVARESIMLITADDAATYWLQYPIVGPHWDADGELHRRGFDDAADTKLATNVEYAEELRVDDKNVYWFTHLFLDDGPFSRLGRVSKSGGTPLLLRWDSDIMPRFLTSDGSTAYFDLRANSKGQPIVLSLEASASKPKPVILLSSDEAEMKNPGFVAVDGGNVYWHDVLLDSDGSVIRARAIAGGAESKFEAPQLDAHKMAISSGNFYWFDDGGALRRRALSGGDEVVLAKGVGGDLVVADDGCYVHDGAKIVKTPR